MSPTKTLLAVAALLAASAPAAAQCTATEVQRIVPADGAAGDEFGGWNVISEGVLMSGTLADDLGADAGAVYVYRYDAVTQEWAFEAKLTASDGEAGDLFFAPALAGNVAAIGAWGDDDGAPDAGATYVFRYDGASWVEEQKLVPPGLDAGDLVAVPATDGRIIAIGASWDDDAANDAGCVYVYRYDGAAWNLEQKLTASDADAGDNLGFPVEISGDRIIAGAYADDDNGSNAGAAYVFAYDPLAQTWIEEAKLTASDGEGSDVFGIVCHIDGDVAVVGATGDDDMGAEAGAAYVYRFDPCTGQWNEEAKLTASDGAAGDSFGGVYVRDDVIISTAPGRNGGDGALYVFQHDGMQWSEVARYEPEAPEAGAFFGSGGWPIENGMCVTGARWEDVNGENSGAMYVLRGLGDCNHNGVLDVCDLANGTSQDANGDGIVDECQAPTCPGDVDGDGTIGFGDLLQILSTWGGCS